MATLTNVTRPARQKLAFLPNGRLASTLVITWCPIGFWKSAHPEILKRRKLDLLTNWPAPLSASATTCPKNICHLPDSSQKLIWRQSSETTFGRNQQSGSKDAGGEFHFAKRYSQTSAHPHNLSLPKMTEINLSRGATIILCERRKCLKYSTATKLLLDNRGASPVVFGIFVNEEVLEGGVQFLGNSPNLNFVWPSKVRLVTKPGSHWWLSRTRKNIHGRN